MSVGDYQWHQARAHQTTPCLVPACRLTNVCQMIESRKNAILGAQLTEFIKNQRAYHQACREVNLDFPGEEDGVNAAAPSEADGDAQ